MSDQAIKNNHKLAWQEYKDRLADSFHGMPQQEQERLLRRGSIVTSVGASLTILNFLYGLFPVWLRILSVPAIAIGSYQLGKRVLTPFVIRNMEKHLNK